MLKGKTALVTGSTSGIGLGIAEKLAAQGANVILNGFGEVDAPKAAVAAAGQAFGIKVGYHGADMSKPAEIEALMAYAQAEFGGVDILVNNAGIQHVAQVEDFPVEKWDAVIAINLSSAFHTMRLAVPGMRAKNWGRIINLASAHGLVASAGKSAYVAAKHGQVGFVKVCALETAREAITCNAICPGYVLTPLVEAQIPDTMKQYDMDRETVVREVLMVRQPSKTFATIEQVAQTVAFLCSPAAEQITGTTISIDGGWTAL